MSALYRGSEEGMPDMLSTMDEGTPERFTERTYGPLTGGTFICTILLRPVRLLYVRICPVVEGACLWSFNESGLGLLSSLLRDELDSDVHTRINSTTLRCVYNACA